MHTDNTCRPSPPHPVHKDISRTSLHRKNGLCLPLCGTHHHGTPICPVHSQALTIPSVYNHKIRQNLHGHGNHTHKLCLQTLSVLHPGYTPNLVNTDLPFRCPPFVLFRILFAVSQQTSHSKPRFITAFCAVFFFDTFVML